jgi:hypothetical protein
MVENQFSYGHIAISPEIEQARRYTQITILSQAGSYQSKKVSLRITGTYKYVPLVEKEVTNKINISICIENSKLSDYHIF